MYLILCGAVLAGWWSLANFIAGASAVWFLLSRAFVVWLWLSQRKAEHGS